MRKEFILKLTAIRSWNFSTLVGVVELTLQTHPPGCGGLPITVIVPMPLADYNAGDYRFGGTFKMTLEREEKS